MVLDTLNVKSCYLGNACSIGCKDYKSDKCKGYWGTLRLGNENIQIPYKYEYEENFFYNIIMEIKKAGYITKQELLDMLSDQYDLKFSSRNLQYYVDEKLIEPGIIERFPGITGSVSFYKENTVFKILAIQELTKKRNFTIEKIKNNKDILYKFDSEKILDYYLQVFVEIEEEFFIPNIKAREFFIFLNYFAFAEANMRYEMGKGKDSVKYETLGKSEKEIHLLSSLCLTLFKRSNIEIDNPIHNELIIKKVIFSKDKIKIINPED